MKQNITFEFKNETNPNLYNLTHIMYEWNWNKSAGNMKSAI